MDHHTYTAPPEDNAQAEAEEQSFSQKLRRLLHTDASSKEKNHILVRRRVGERLISAVRGLLFGGIAYLFGTCVLPFDTAPLGIALLAASTSGAGTAGIYRPSAEPATLRRTVRGRRGTAYPWYILGGLILASLTHLGTLPPSGWIGIYAFCVLLRLAVLFFVDPPLLPGETVKPGFRGALHYAGHYLLLCLRSAQYNLGWSSLLSRDGDNDLEKDYYAGIDHRRARHAASGAGARASTGASDSHDPVGADGHAHDAEDGAPCAADSRPVYGPPADARLFCEHPFLRILTGAVTGFAAGACALVRGGFAVYDLFGTLFLIVSVPLCVLLLCPIFCTEGEALIFAPHPLSADEDNRPGGVQRFLSRFKLLPILSAASLVPGVVYAARDIPAIPDDPWFILRISTLIGLILTLSAASRLGFIPGLAVGLLAGLGDDWRLLPAYLLTAGVYTVLRVLSHRAGVIGGCAFGLIWCAAYGKTVLLLYELPAFLLAIPCFLLLERVWEKMPTLPEENRFRVSDFTLAVAGEARIDAQRNRLAALSAALSGLSETFYRLSDKQKRPKTKELRRLCTDVIREGCASCRNNGACFTSGQKRTEAVICALTEQLEAHGVANVASLPDELKDFCPHMKEFVTEINTRCAQLTGTLLRSEKTEVFASDYADMAALLTDALTEDSREYRCNRDAADRIYDYLVSLGLRVQGVVVCGRRNCRVIVRGLHLDEASKMKDAIRTQLCTICDAHLSEPAFEVGDDYTVMVLTTEPMLDAVYAGSTAPAGTGEGEPLPPPLTNVTAPGDYLPPPICGDHIAIFRSEQACLYALISDGMGSGEEASATSDICAVFLEKMLAAGSRVEISLRMLNSVLRSRNDGTGGECSATVDLLELDLTNGHAIFAKSGASPTYVVRGGTVYKLRSRTLPIGILRDSTPQLLRFRMHPGDVVVMVSDGVTLGNDECPWLIDLLSDPLPDDMDRLRLDILRRAIASGSPDDLSAIAIRVENAGERR